jgi:hypothetical protein
MSACEMCEEAPAVVKSTAAGADLNGGVGL